MYYIAFGFFYLFSLLPFRVLYWFSDCMAFLLYYVFHYRKDVVFSNLAAAFPEKTAAERKKIAKKFYRNFSDNWLETIKMLSISEKNIGKRITTDLDVLQEIYASGRCCDILLGHQFNWEWCNACIPVRVPFRVLVAYSPINNKIIDRLFLHLRQRFGCILLPFNDMRRAMLPHRNSQYLLGLVADQNPASPDKSYWINFLGMATPFLKGPEKGARIGNIPAAYMSFHKIKRGHYQLTASLLFKNPADTVEGELTRKYVSLLEENIRKYPESYLWSHRRWKHLWKEEYKKLWIDLEPLPLVTDSSEVV
ncbi:MAG: lysophospholipid acyltransferase family protein [Ferruginibacter sp.]